MREHYEPPSKYTWIVNAIAMVMVGILVGYVLSASGGRGSSPAPAVTNTAAVAPAAPIVDEAEVRAYRDILASDPKNLQAAVKLGNLLYDAKRYVEAIPYYQQAFALNPKDINVSTDLGTALWYAGRPDEALAQYDRSIAINATHAQTLFNMGIVKADGKQDYAGAAAAWEKLLATNPTYPEIERVRSLISDARAKAGIQ